MKRVHQLGTQLGARLGALLALTSLVGGIPWLFAATIGNPLHGWSDLRAGDLSDTVVIDILALIVWIAWAQFTISVLIETYAAARRAPLPSRIPGVFAAQQHLARTLVVTALLAATTATTALASVASLPLATALPRPSALPATAVLAASQTHRLVTAQTPADHSLDPARHRARDGNQASPRAAAGPGTSVYVVPESGDGPDNFWDIAEAKLGAGDRWREIWALNEGRTQADGTVMTDPGLLLPGWTVLLPSLTDTTASQLGVTVTPGDTLTEIAIEHHVTEPRVWALNEDRVMSDGRVFTDPDLIKPGDTILIPGPPHETSTHPSPPAPPQRDHAGPTRTPTRTVPTPPSPDEPTPSTAPADVTPRPATAAPTPAPHGTGTSGDRAVQSVAGYIAVVGGGAGLLAAALLAAVRRYRRRQLRHRPAGHTLAPTAPALRELDAALHITGAPAASTIDILDRAVRSLAYPHQVDDSDNAGDGTVPSLTSVIVDDSTVRITLATDATPLALDAPWTSIGRGTWQVDRALLEHHPFRADEPAPYPALVSVIHDTGRETLLNLTHFGVVVVAGDDEVAANWLRFVAGELAHNPWADHMAVTIANLEPGLVALNPARLAHTDDLPGAASLLAHPTDLPEIVILGPGWSDSEANLDAITHGVATLTEPLGGASGGHGSAALLAYLPSIPADDDSSVWSRALHVHIGSDGLLHIPTLDLHGSPAQLPAADAADLATLLAAARRTDLASYLPLTAEDDYGYPPTSDEVPATPVSSAGVVAAAKEILPRDDRDHTHVDRPDEDPAIIDRAPGATSAPLSVVPWAEPLFDVSSLLPAPDDHYVAHTATTIADINYLAPAVTLEFAADVHAADPALDADLAAWRDPDSSRAKLTLLGPVTLIAHGRVPDGRIAFYTEAITYLALHPRGVTGDRFAADLWPERSFTGRDSSPKNALSIARKWLGIDPMTGLEYLPIASTAVPGGVPTYRIEGLLIDWDLFRRLRARAQTGGETGIADLRAALDLVTGEPLSRRRLDGYGWLRDGTCVDEDALSVAVIDAAHTVATAALAADDIATAQRVVDIALSVGPADDRPLLDQAAILDAQGRAGELAATVRRIRAHHDAEVEEDLPPRTYEVLLRRGWLTG